MELNEYQRKALNTWTLENKSILVKLSYLGLGLPNEAGEVAGKLKKAIRDTDGEVTNETRTALLGELGDVLWYLSTLAHELGLTLDYVAATNIEKLTSRKERGVIQGSGDNR